MGALGPAIIWTLIGIAILAAAVAAWVTWDNLRLTVTHYTLETPKLTGPIRIVHLSDLHNRQFGPENSRLLSAVAAEHPDCIAFTGDLLDRRQPYSEASARFVTELTRLAPVYFVFGNQEIRGGHAERLRKALTQSGVHVLDNAMDTLTVRGQTISMLGLNDFESHQLGLRPFPPCRALLRHFEGAPGFRLLLSHYPHYFAGYRRAYQYSRYDIDLFLAGHAHGGLIRLPFLPGVYAPGQGVFPCFTAGFYRQGHAAMLVSRGLGNSGLPRRIHNPPELVVLDLLPARRAAAETV